MKLKLKYSTDGHGTVYCTAYDNNDPYASVPISYGVGGTVLGAREHAINNAKIALQIKKASEEVIEVTEES